MFKTFSHAVQRLGLHSHAGFWGPSPLCLRQAASGCLLYSCWGPPGYAAQRGHLSLHQPRQFRQPVRQFRCPSAYATLQPDLMRGSTSKLQPRASSQENSLQMSPDEPQSCKLPCSWTASAALSAQLLQSHAPVQLRRFFMPRACDPQL